MNFLPSKSGELVDGKEIAQIVTEVAQLTINVSILSYVNQRLISLRLMKGVCIWSFL